MNRNTFVYVSLAILIACLAFSHFATESAAQTCSSVVSWVSGICNDKGKCVTGSATPPNLFPTCGHPYPYCCCRPNPQQRQSASAPAPTPAPAPAPTPTPTPASRAQTPSQTPSQSAPRRPAQPQQQSCKKPTIHFKTWTVGGPEGRVIAKDTSFITTTETTCKVYAEVTYSGSQDPSTTCEITGANWTVTMSHGFTVDATTVDTDSPGEGFSKVWTYEATLTGPEMRTPKNWDCNEKWLPNGPSNSDKKEYAGRNQQRMSMTISFSGSYSGGTVEVSQLLSQSAEDGIRQEYVDYNLNVIPDRGDFRGDSNIRYNWGHYPAWAIDKDLPGRHEQWAKWVDPTFTTANLALSSGYRHPYHNFYCVGATAKHGLHHYGLALDVSADLDNSGSVTKTEKDKVTFAARKAGVDSRHIFRYGNTKHIHADWRPTDWRTRRTTANSTIGTPRSVVPAPAPPSNNGGSDDSDEDEDEDEDDGGASGGSGDTAPAAPAGNGGSGDDDSDDDDDDSSSSSRSTRTPFVRGHPGYGQTWSQWVNRDRTCRRCGTTFNRSNNSTCTGWGRTYPYHWAR